MTQTADVQGSDHNTVVQIDGNGNTVVLGQPHLRLTRLEAEGNKPLTDARLLIPARRAIPLFGRDDELKSLLDFVRPDAPPDIRVRVLVGSGGSGKTRLALELCDQIKDCWLAGFVTTDALDKFFKQQDAGSWGWQKPTLMVLDYAAAQAEVLRKWLPELLDRTTPPKYPLRLLLLERHADPQSGWHERVFNPGGWQNAGLRDLLDPPEPIRIRPLFEVADRMGVLRAVLQLVAPTLVPLLTSDLLEAQFQNTSWGGDPLYLAMAALTMARRGDVSALQLGRTDLALEVAGHEMQRLAQAAETKGLERELVQHLAACITLLQGLPRAEALGLIRAEKAAIGFDHGDPAVLTEVLHDCLTDGERITGVQPDLIGEALLLKAWAKPERAAAIARLFAGHTPLVLETLVRLVQDFSEADPKPRAWFAALLKDHWNDAHALQQIDAAVPGTTVALSDINLQLARRLLELDSNSNPESLAHRWARLSVALSDVGQPEAALQAAQQAADLYRELAPQSPDAYTPYWATSLNNLANRLGTVGQHEAALQVAQEAADLRRELALQRPDTYTPDWAMSLNNLAAMLRDVGQHEAALQAALQAADLRRELARQRPNVYTPNWATSLNNLAAMLSDVGQHEAALKAAQQAADLYRELSRQRPDAYTPNWATSLSNLAAMLHTMGQHEAALQAAQQAADLRRELARQRPHAYTADWAASLNNLGNMLSAVGQYEDALQAAQQAADLYRELARQRPDAYTPDWATSQNNLAAMLSSVGQHEAALQAAQQAADLRRELARQRPDAYTPDWAMSLNTLANGLSAMGQHEAALQAAQQAVDLYRELARQRPDAFTRDWATSLIVLALSQSDCGEHEQAARQAHQAVQVLSPAFLQRPKALGGLMGAMLREYVRLCQAAQMELDMNLLAPLLPYFQDPDEENPND